MFKLICMQCGREVFINTDEKGHFVKDGVTILQTINDDLEIECDCGNKVVL
jgi:DNA-directed RNA polymerase subunit RPC12/RpoP